MDLFYTKDISESKLSLDESKHCLISLRKKIDDKILVTDGKGIIYACKIKNIDNKQVIYEQQKMIFNKNSSTKLHIAVAPTKNKVRFEWLLEKATEIGVDIISPMICDHSERIKINYDRSERILISALKQSKNAILPQLNKIQAFQDLIQNYKKNSFIAHCYNLNQKKLNLLVENINNPSIITLFIGPEGDFSEKELNFAKKQGILSVTLGEQRLRTETAAVVGCYMIKSLL